MDESKTRAQCVNDARWDPYGGGPEPETEAKGRPYRGKTAVLTAPDRRPRFLSEAECHDIAQRLARLAQGGGYTTATIVSTWRGNVRWARNQISTTGEDRNDHIVVNRNVRGAKNMYVEVNSIADEALLTATRRAERLAALGAEEPEYNYDVLHEEAEPYVAPYLFYESTYQLDSERRAEAARHLMQSATAAGMLSAGYIDVSAHSMALINSLGYARYYQYTWAQYSVTVRDPDGVGSGWAGIDWPDWNKIDGEQLSTVALDKCLKSRKPVAIEPGRYTTILEPQAVCDFVEPLVGQEYIDRWNQQNGANEGSNAYPFHKTDATRDAPGFSRLGERVVDARISISADPMDPELGFPPFRNLENMFDTGTIVTDIYHPATWVKDGVLVNMGYPREYAISELGKATGLPNSGAFRMSVTGPTVSVEEMIQATRRGLLVTRFDDVNLLELRSQTCRGYTRDGLWLIENGKISKAVKNMMFVESILFVLNNVEQLGVPQRVFHPLETYKTWSNPQPVIVPPLMIKDFSFTALSDAV